jgi:dolichol-phosphate mannosyltransferase
MLAGMKHSRGKAIVTMDGDFQDPPELIARLYEKFMEGNKVVYARRISRQEESFFKRSTANLFYRLLQRITAVEIPIDTGDFRLISDEVLTSLQKLKEANKFLRGQIAWLGYKPAYIEFNRPGRKSGETKFTLTKSFRLALDGITSFSNFPLQIAMWLGFTFSLVAFAIILYALYSRFILDEVVSGWTSIIISTMFIGGVQLLCLGIIGEYLIRIGSDARQRPDYIIEDSNLLPDAKRD